MNQNWPIPTVVPRLPQWDLGVPDQQPEPPMQQSPMQQPPMQPPQGILPQQPQGGGLLSGMGKPGGFMERANNWMTPERALALQGIGMGLSQLAAGRPADLSPVHEALGKRQREKQMREAMEAPAITELFTPQQRAILAQMPENMALEIVAGKMFAEPPMPSPQSPIGKIEADFRAGLIPEDVYMAEMERQAGSHQLITGEVAAAMGLDPNKSYNRGPDGRLYEIGGGGTNVSIDNRADPVPATGFRNVYDDEGRLVAQEPVPGGPADLSQRAAAETAEKEAQARGRTKATTATTLIDELTGAFGLKQGLGWNPETGEYGDPVIAGPRIRKMIADNPTGLVAKGYAGTATYDFMEGLKSIQDTIGIERLLEIKESGSGLGAVPAEQLRQLARALGALDPGMSDALLRNNLDRILTLYTDIVIRSLQDETDPAFRGMIADMSPFVGMLLGGEGQEEPAAGAGEMSDDDLLRLYGG